VSPGQIAAFPGSFDPLTVAHLAIVDAAVAQLELVRVDLVLSEVAIDKDHGGHASLAERVAAIEAAARDGRTWLHARVTTDRLIADIALGYDVCVVGADKWHQLFDARFYGGSAAARDAAVARLPLLAVAPRDGSAPPHGDGFVLLDLAPEHRVVSSTAVRAGRDDWRA
jgi:Cytidylyltransferase-like